MARPIDPNDPVFLRGLTQRRLGRRDFLRGAGVGAGTLSLAAILAACSSDSSSTTPASGSAAAGTFDGDPAGEMNMANWALYIDKAKDPQTGEVTHPSLDKFTADTGIKVNYREVIDSPETFFGKLQPVLAAGQDTGWDIMVITNGRVFDTMNRLGYFQELPGPERFPNFQANAGPAVKGPSYDPENKYSIAYQSGITGIGWDPVLVAQLRPDNPTITSIQDLYDPAFAGKVGMFGDTLDMPSLALLGIGVAPEDSTPADWQAAADVITKARDDGIVRQFFAGSGYINSLAHGDVAVAMAWSGDIFQSNLSGDSNGLQFTIPTEGGAIWTDNMTIPPLAQHPVDAVTYMDYIYQPEVMAMMVEWINYVSPVPAAQQVILADAAKATDPADKTYLENVANSPLVFPTPQDAEHLYNYRTLTQEEDQQWLDIWQPISQS